MIFKILKKKDFTLDLMKVKYRGERCVPTCNVVRTDDGICLDEKGNKVYDEVPFVKLYRPQLIDQLNLPEFRLFVYIMEKMNRFNVVEIEPESEELYEFTGFKQKSQLYCATKRLREKSVLIKETSTRLIWKVSEECMRRYSDPKKEDKRPFVKIYQPRALLALNSTERAVMYYICCKVDFEGVVKIDMHDFLDMTGYKQRNERDERGRRKCEPNAVNLCRGKHGLKRKGFIKDISLIVDDGDKVGRGIYFRINPNIFFRGNRLKDGGYGVAISDNTISDGFL